MKPVERRVGLLGREAVEGPGWLPGLALGSCRGPGATS